MCNPHFVKHPGGNLLISQPETKVYLYNVRRLLLQDWLSLDTSLSASPVYTNLPMQGSYEAMLQSPPQYAKKQPVCEETNHCIPAFLRQEEHRFRRHPDASLCRVFKRRICQSCTLEDIRAFIPNSPSVSVKLDLGWSRNLQRNAEPSGQQSGATDRYLGCQLHCNPCPRLTKDSCKIIANGGFASVYRVEFDTSIPSKANCKPKRVSPHRGSLGSNGRSLTLVSGIRNKNAAHDNHQLQHLEERI